MVEITLVGKKYRVQYHMSVGNYTDYSRGDHGMGGGSYKVSYGTGDVVVRDRSGRCLAACGLGYSNTNESGHLREVSEDKFKRCIEIADILPHRLEDYVDWLAKKWIERFRFHRGQGVPRFQLEPLDRTELIQQGFVLDADGQASLAL